MCYLSAVAKISHCSYLQPLGPPCGYIVLCEFQECPFFVEAACNVRLCDCERVSLNIRAFCLLPSVLFCWLTSFLLFAHTCGSFFFSLYTMSSTSFEGVALLYNFLHEWCVSCSLFIFFIFFWLFNFAVNNTFKFLYFFISQLRRVCNCSHYISCARKVIDPGRILLCTAKLALWF